MDKNYSITHTKVWMPRSAVGKLDEHRGGISRPEWLALLVERHSAQLRADLRGVDDAKSE